jgi:hypothetical protein
MNGGEWKAWLRCMHHWFLGSGLAAGCGGFEEALGRLPGDRSRACPEGRHVCPKALDGSVFPGGWQHQRTHKSHPCQNLCDESMCVLMMPPTPNMGSTAPCSGEWWSVVGPAGGMCTDDLGDQFLHQRVRVVVSEGRSPFRVFARLVLVAAHPLERLGEIGDRVEWNPHHVHLGYFGDEWCFLGVPVGDGGSHLTDQLGEDVVAIPLFI